MLEPADAAPLPGTLDAIADADLITLGPGSLYTSLITNLLVRGIPEALAASKATRVFVCNLMTQANESLGLTASQHIEKILAARRQHQRPASSTTPSSTPRPSPPHAVSSTPARASSPSRPTSTASAPSASNPSPATSSTRAKSCATTTTRSPRLVLLATSGRQIAKAHTGTKELKTREHIASLVGRSALRLEPLSLAHLPALDKVAFDERIWRYMNQRITTPAELRGWADASLRLQGAGMNHALGHRPEMQHRDRVVGSTRFIDLDLRHKTVEIGNTWLTPTVHGSGINPEAKLLQLTYAFEDPEPEPRSLQDPPRKPAIPGRTAQTRRPARRHLPQPLHHARRHPAPQRLVLASRKKTGRR